MEKKAPNVVRVRDLKSGQSGIPAKATIYKLHSLRKHPRLIYIIPGSGLVFDLDEWTHMCEAAQNASVERSVNTPKLEQGQPEASHE